MKWLEPVAIYLVNVQASSILLCHQFKYLQPCYVRGVELLLCPPESTELPSCIIIARFRLDQKKWSFPAYSELELLNSHFPEPWQEFKTIYTVLLEKTYLPTCSLLLHRHNVASLSLFYQYFYRKCSDELCSLAPSDLYSQDLSCHIQRFKSPTFPPYSTCNEEVPLSFFMRMTMLWNKVPRGTISISMLE